MNTSPHSPTVSIHLPEWIHGFVDWNCLYSSSQDRMKLAIALSRENVMQKTGGPFGAAISERESGQLVSVGVNSVVRLFNSTLHGEMVAFMMAQARLNRFSLAATDSSSYELITSCEPCSMCLGAILWSGVKRVICGAAREDATRLGFEEGPVFPESYRYLEQRGVEFVLRVLRAEAREILELYRQIKGPIYNS